MKIFIGSSTESAEIMGLISDWLNGHEVVRWNARGTFPPTGNLFDELINKTREVDGAIFVFGEDDFTLSRDKVSPTTRDNVVLEYGLSIQT